MRIHVDETALEGADATWRAQVFYIVSGSTFLVTAGYSITNYFEDDVAEMWVDILLATGAVGAGLALWRNSDDRSIYRLFLGGSSVGLCYLVAIGAGGQTALYYPLMLPLVLFFFLGRHEGTAATITLLICLSCLVLLPALFGTYPYARDLGLRFVVAFVLMTIIGWSHESARERFRTLVITTNEQLAAEKEQLRTALDKLETLRGLIPICAACKRIRDDDGYWQQVETYVSQHSALEFTHGLCPDCENRLHPELA